jgi:endonuclease I
MPLKEFYEVTIDYEGSLYCGVTLEWNHEERYVDISMPGYVKKQLLKYKHPNPKKPVHTATLGTTTISTWKWQRHRAHRQQS